MRSSIIIVLLYSLSIQLFSQNPVLPTPFDKRKINTDLPTWGKYPATNIGPTVMSGRVADIDINPDDPTEFYVAYASGGLWHTTNNGTTFHPIFDDQDVMTIGDIAIHWPTRTIYVGTGEVNSSRSSYAGNGIYKSVDNGASWTHCGLEETHHIGRIIVDNSNPDLLWVAALGHLYSYNPERGIYFSKNGGKSWDQTLYVNEKSGAVDLIRDQQSPNVFYTAIWQRDRKSWNFEEAGPGSGIYKSVDSGMSWTILPPSNGFPTGDGVGRIGLALSYDNNKTYLYALLDNYNRRPSQSSTETSELNKREFKLMSKEDFLKLEPESIASFLKKTNFPKQYSYEFLKDKIQSDEFKPSVIYDYLEDSNALLFDTDVIGAEVYVSSDEGSTFRKTHSDYIDHLYNSYGYYFGQIRVEPNDPKIIYIMGVPILRSDDGGKNWSNINRSNVHVDHHALWINPQNPNHLINGNDGGINISYDKGENWIKCNSPSVGQFYYVNVDNQNPYHVYAGAQDNGVWSGSHQYNAGISWHSSGKYPYDFILGGDGMQVQIDERNANIVYTGFQFGHYFRIDRASGKRSYITPKHELGDHPYRWNWQSPILISPHNQDIVYMGSNKLLRSMDQGENFQLISEDLTNGGKKGDVSFGTLTSIDESHFDFGKIVTGSDDGLVHMTKDGGNSWHLISKDLPQNLWVSRVQFSKHDPNTIYVALNGYRWDNFEPYLYKSTDNGSSWSQIAKALPHNPINVIKEDPNDSNILYVGTDNGLYLSLDQGISFQRWATNLPNVPIHDLVIQKEFDHLILGTHGRSLYLLDLLHLKSIETNSDLQLLSMDSIQYNAKWGTRRNVYSKYQEPVLKISLYSKKERKCNLSIGLPSEKPLYNEDITLNIGLNQIDYNLDINTKNRKKSFEKDEGKMEQSQVKDNNKSYLPFGVYDLQVKCKNEEVKGNLIIYENK